MEYIRSDILPTSRALTLNTTFFHLKTVTTNTSLRFNRYTTVLLRHTPTRVSFFKKTQKNKKCGEITSDSLNVWNSGCSGRSSQCRWPCSKV